MEKLILKGKKEVKNLLVDSLHQTIQALGISKSSKKADKLVERSAKKLAAVVADRLKKDRKKLTKATKKSEPKKKELVTA
ncbi:MAG: hypothetical protein HOP30_20380 [Cyclobacteriaceae bacterium]|nr:hypothetical protein [Cyclobacteriaceae bacterium]